MYLYWINVKTNWATNVIGNGSDASKADLHYFIWRIYAGLQELSIYDPRSLIYNISIGLSEMIKKYYNRGSYKHATFNKMSMGRGCNCLNRYNYYLIYGNKNVTWDLCSPITELHDTLLFNILYSIWSMTFEYFL